MTYSTETVRRQDRLLDEPNARALLSNGEYGVLSVQATEGGGYGIPISFVWDGQSALYLHCAPQGRKIDAIEQCNKVSFCVVGKTKVIPQQFTTAYESILLTCEAHIDLTTDERMKALMLLVKKYAPEHQETGALYAKKVVLAYANNSVGRCSLVGKK